MTMLFRSKSCGVNRTPKSTLIYSPPSSSLYLSPEEEEEDEEDEEDGDNDDVCFAANRVRTPFMVQEKAQIDPNQNNPQQNQGNQFQILDIVMAVLRKSLITCSVVTDEVSSTDIGWPTEVRHVSHVTFDRFNGFLGLPVELQPDVPRKVPSASASVFGVSAKSMQCSYDENGNSVPTILLMMQKRLYLEGGLQAEGIFRINGENSKEEYVRQQLNKGIIPHEVDVHCLAGLIKAWFRELPSGVLDSLNPENVMQCNTEEDCTKLVKLLPPTEAALLDWGINLMTDVVKHEHLNKMNARNIAMVFAPNMTQMADPLTALLHAVQVMNLLKTLIIVKLRENSLPEMNRVFSCSHRVDLDGVDHDHDHTKDEYEEDDDQREGEGIMEKLKLKKRVRRLYRHPVFQLRKTVKKTLG
ncbi:rho GTPase-activating protein 5-like [Impatiens glandulifera]|uniref:rho GTPase-activating protein 5-like n=1 Tax=Impatiens glandulifera TaxID=253017 RepID=UPI001FB150C1|nr:rho GTPase-activating protein 5-like [Impatiens glandulifera]